LVRLVLEQLEHTHQHLLAVQVVTLFLVQSSQMAVVEVVLTTKMMLAFLAVLVVVILTKLDLPHKVLLDKETLVVFLTAYCQHQVVAVRELLGFQIQEQEAHHPQGLVVLA
jgi:hypothetical protein